MPQYLYRREDGTTFTITQKFSEDALTVDPETGQQVVRVVQPSGIIFKGSGFYVNDSKNASKRNYLNGSSSDNGHHNSNGHSENGHSDNGHSSNGSSEKSSSESGDAGGKAGGKASEAKKKTEASAVAD